jgi:hypothetical protein
MSKRNVQWLYEELPGLVGKGVLPAETAEKLRQHYGNAETGGGKRWAIILFGILGGALIGAGVILLLAHNWDEFSRPVRAALSFAPLVGFGSAYYHLNLCDATLVWDRLPMTVAFMSFFAALMAERWNERVATWLFVPLLAFGIGSIVYWQQNNDLRCCGVVQFGPMLAIPVLLAVRPAQHLRTSDLWIVLGWYAAAKVMERADAAVFAWGGVVSGHTVKHFAAATGCGWVLRALGR